MKTSVKSILIICGILFCTESTKVSAKAKVNLKPDTVSESATIVDEKINEPITGVSAVKTSEQIRIYPVPAKNEINIDLDEALSYSFANASIRIYDIKGNMVMSGNTAVSPKMKIHLYNIPEGVYVLSMDFGKWVNNKIFTIK